MAEPVYVIGIDLGTTNSIVAYTEANVEKGVKPVIKVLQIPQVVDSGSSEERDVLPSFIFIPGEHDVSEGALDLPWQSDNKTAVGEFARNRGAEIPHRMIASAKSWLCHTMVDRNKPILPWEGPDDTHKMSPVEASSMILAHIRDAWNYAMAAEDDALAIENQEIYLTVPASFDAVARDLTVKAAEMAGLDNVTLLEEPQAAFYAWIEASDDQWREQIEKGDLVLVCDIGGGTTDFSLIKVTEEDGDLSLERIAVGDHLLVGGDNMDLALAYSVSQNLAESGTRLDSWQIRGLWHTCRAAKEKLLGDDAVDDYPITILGRGSSLIGGTIKSNLAQEEVKDLIVDGFFPSCDMSHKPAMGQKTGIQELGLAYEADPAVTHHMAKFLSQLENNDETPNVPTAILFNGGIMKSSLIRKRILEVVSSWDTEGDAEGEPAVREIFNRDFDLAVARGAAYYGLARRGQGIRIRGGLSKTYYIGVAASMPAVPGMPAPLKALCVAPFGMEEGTEAALKDQEFVVVVGEPAKFDLLGSAVRFDDTVGKVIEDWDDVIDPITTIETTLEGAHGTVIPVTIEIKVTEIGTLEFWCVSKTDDQRWKLEFNVREKE